ncbi:MAG: hypothetical protein M3063_06575 [Actinomycetota bacterium]|nr:hypothetical protein [Actinomycetota bacterium]
MGTQRRAWPTLTALATVVAVVVAGCGGGHRSAAAKVTTTTAGGTTSTTTFTLEPPSSSVGGPASTTVTTNPLKSSPTTLPPTTPTTARASTVSEQAALGSLVATYPPRSSVNSGIVQTGSIIYVALAHNVGLRSVIDIFVFQGSRFVDVAANIGADQSLHPVDPTTIRKGNITGAQFPDFLVPLAAGDHDNGVLVSYVGGGWHLIGLSDRLGAAASEELVQPNIIGNEITQSVKDCSPSCARGTYLITNYVYAGGIGKLMARGPTVQSPTA